MLFSDSSLQEWNKPQNVPQYALSSDIAAREPENVTESNFNGNHEEKRLKFKE